MYVNGKMRPVETISGMGGGRDKGEWWREWIQVWYIWYIVRIFVNAVIYPQHNNEKKSIYNFFITLLVLSLLSLYFQICTFIHTNLSLEPMHGFLCTVNLWPAITRQGRALGLSSSSAYVDGAYILRVNRASCGHKY
jgi:hypothetical protein